MFHMIITVNTDYFTQQYFQSGRRKLDVFFTKWKLCFKFFPINWIWKRSCHIPSFIGLMGYYYFYYYYCHHHDHHKTVTPGPRVMIASQVKSIILFCLASCPVCCLWLHLAEPLLRICIEGLQRAFHLRWSRTKALTPFHSIPLFFKSSLSLLPKPVGVFLCVSTLCFSLPGHNALSVISHSYNVPRPSQMC